MSETPKARSTTPLSADRPQVNPDDDRFGYAPFAKHLAQGLLRGCPADGLVVGVYGPWGCGKSTVLNFILHYMAADTEADPPTVVHFNPWWFAGQDDLVRRFFQQFEASLFESAARKKGLLKKVAAFGAAFESFGVPYAGPVGKLAKGIVEAKERDVIGLKRELVQALAKDPKRIVVVIDDVDRLASEEVRQLFKVIKAVADFPNVVYLLAFDPDVVTAALEGVYPDRGAKYLEKIVQVSFSVPPPDRTQLQSLLLDGLNTAFAGTPKHLLDEQRWGNLYFSGIDALVSSPRDVMRFVNALSVTYPAVLGEVDAVDFFGIEALRIFLPRVYQSISQNPDMFTGAGPPPGSQVSRIPEREFHDAWLADAGASRMLIESILTRLFPLLDSLWSSNVYDRKSETEWRRGFRVCSAETFPIYFQLSLAQGEVSAATLREFLRLAIEPNQMAERLRSLGADSRPDGRTLASSLLQRLSDTDDQRLPDNVIEPLLAALFDAGDDISRAIATRAEPFDLDQHRVERLVWRLLKRLGPERSATVLKRAFSEGQAIFTVIRALGFVGRQHGLWGAEKKAENNPYLAVDAVTELKPIVLQRVRSAGADGSLWKSVQPLALLEAWRVLGDVQEMNECVRTRLQSDDALLEFVSWFVTRVRSSGVHDHVAKVTPRIDPDRIAAFASVGEIEARVPALLARPGLGDDHAVLLTTFLRGVAARKAGKDPMDLWDEDE